jgi:hypothetical protein
MAMTLLREVQELMERTYATTGINLEHCLVGPSRCAVLSRAAGDRAEELSASGRTFLRWTQNCLFVAIYFADSVIEALEEHDPRRVLNDRNISPLIIFVEEIAHGVQASLLFLEGERDFHHEACACNLETQARVDTFLVLCRYARQLCGTPTPKDVLGWLHRQVFDDSHERFGCPSLRARYTVTRQAALRFVDILQSHPLDQRHCLLREFRALAWGAKLAWLSAREGIRN